MTSAAAHFVACRDFHSSSIHARGFAVLRWSGKRDTPDRLPLSTAPGETLQGPALRRAMSFVTVSWVFGSVWATATGGAPYSLFVKHLHASEFQIGLLAALPFLASLLNIPATVLTERTGQRKKIFLWTLYAQRLLWFPIAIVPVLLARYVGVGAAASVFLVLVFCMHAVGALGGPGWLSWMADIVPDRLRGKYFSRRRQWGIVSAIPAAILVGWLVDHLMPNGGGSGAIGA